MDGITCYHDRDAEIVQELVLIENGEKEGTTMVNGEEFDHTEWLFAERDKISEKIEDIEATFTISGEFAGLDCGSQ